ncbi:MAG: glycoside hydrolase family 3 C-terminal domain-containing protein [Candidatus Cloacimonetes bacterium]|nr:glycoside hydrolase family 3 C-terminal domain-containing protein [Candidatus Cloacimonadota bacterium]
MTPEEKFWQLYMIPGDLSEGKEKFRQGIFGLQVHTKGNSTYQAEQLLDYSESYPAEETAIAINEIQKFFVEETRLGIPIIPFDEALHGLIRKGATVFPQAIGIAASWNIELMQEISTAIAIETKSRGIRQVLSPVVNIARDVRWGRTEETYGEDPFLTTQMALAFVESFEKMGVITTPKHFVANVGDGGRDSYPIHFSERLLEEIYFPAFKACIMNAGSRSIMTAYNSLNGRPCTANSWLLNEKLKKDWAFQGFVITDAGAIGGEDVLHNIASGFAKSTREAFQGGLDVIFQTSYEHYPLFFKAFEEGMIDQEIIDNAVRRVLRVKFELGLFEEPYTDPATAGKYNACETHRKLARKAACEASVLLKNENNILPLKKEITSIAVIGADAAEARLGGYSGPGDNAVSILDGIKSRTGKTVQYARGCSRVINNMVTIPGANLLNLQGEYFNNISLEGEPVLVRIDDKIDFGWTLFSPEPEKVNFDFFSVRWTGKLKPSATGSFHIGIKGDDGYRLFVDDELIIDNWKKQTFQQITQLYEFEKDREYDLKLEFYETTGNVRLKIIWDLGIEHKHEQEMTEAVKIAENCDIAIVVVGIEEGEFRDRALLGLPGNQEELINKIAETGKPVVVILVGGSAITMENWRNNVQAILDVWYPGEEGGNAVAEILFGNYNPAGRLPITFPVHESQLPLYYNHKPTGRGDDYPNLTGKPLFPFGYGLSYTNFIYSDLHICKNTVSCRITNTGEFDGDEVVQLYIKDVLSSFSRPVLELKGFQRIHLKKGESRKVEFTVTKEMLSALDENLEPVVEPGEFRIMIGASSNDIRLRGILQV